MVLREEGRTSWGIDPFNLNAAEPCIHGFLRLIPHGVLNVC